MVRTERPTRDVTGLGLVGLVGIVATAVVAVGGSVEWGAPGTPAYETYELVNRLTGLAILLVVATPLDLRAALAERPGSRGARQLLVGAAILLIGMALGSAAEFWLFTDQPYRGPGSEGRLAAWMTFLVCGIAFITVSIAVGLSLIRRRLAPMMYGLAVTLAGPAGIVAAGLGASLFIGIPLVGLAMWAASSAARRS